MILDANHNPDDSDYAESNFHWYHSNIPEQQRRWLADDLAATKLPSFAFCHQALDVNRYHPGGIRDARGVRKILSASGKVTGVFQGHTHISAKRTLGGVHYTTLYAMAKGSGKRNSGYAVLEIFPSGDCRLLGYRRQRSHSLPAHFA